MLVNTRQSLLDLATLQVWSLTALLSWRKGKKQRWSMFVFSPAASIPNRSDQNFEIKSYNNQENSMILWKTSYVPRITIKSQTELALIVKYQVIKPMCINNRFMLINMATFWSACLISSTLIRNCTYGGFHVAKTGRKIAVNKSNYYGFLSFIRCIPYTCICLISLDK